MPCAPLAVPVGHGRSVPGLLCHLVDVAPSGEGPVTAAGQHYRPDIVVPLHRSQSGIQLLVEGLAKGVQDPGAVQRDDAHTIRNLDEDVLVVHQCPPA